MYNGLTDDEVIISRKKNGSNELNRLKKDSFLKLLIGALGDPIIKILLIALAIKTIFLFRNFAPSDNETEKLIAILIFEESKEILDTVEAVFLCNFFNTFSAVCYNYNGQL